MTSFVEAAITTIPEDEKVVYKDYTRGPFTITDVPCLMFGEELVLCAKVQLRISQLIKAATEADGYSSKNYVIAYS